MKREFIAYLNALGASDVIVSKARSLHDLFSTLLKKEIMDIFINDFITQDGNRQFETLWYITDTFLIQAKNFLQTDNFEVIPYVKQVISIDIQVQDYNFIEATDQSRFNLTVYETNSKNVSFKASKMNCDYLKEIFLRYLKPNFLDLVSPADVRIVE